MQQFLYFEKKSTLLLKKLLASTIDLGKVKINMTNFIKYMNSDYEKNLELYKTNLNIDSIVLENLVDSKYKFLFKGIELKNFVSFLEDLENRIKDFNGKEINLRILVGIYFLYYVLIIRLVETYLGAISTYNIADPNNINYTLKDIGIDNSIIRYFANFEDLRQKTIDEWIKIDIDVIEERYYMSALKRILTILGAY